MIIDVLNIKQKPKKMKKVIYSVVMLVLLTGTAMCQSAAQEVSKGTPGANPDSKGVYTQVDVMPMFTGGNDALYNYLATNLKYPTAAKEAKIQGTVFVQFIINADGKISNVKIRKGMGGECDGEAKRVIESMPAWTPGKQKGQVVAVQYTLPIKFSLEK
jgi:TonB family protein